MYRSDIDEPAEWERVAPFKTRVAGKIQAFFHHAFLRDVRINKIQVAKIVLRSLILIALLLFWIKTLFGQTPAGYDSSNMLQWIISIVGGGIILFTGMVTDNLIEKHGIFEKVSLAAIIPMLVLLVVNVESIVIMAMLAFTILVAFLIVFFIAGLVINTTMLNRARVIVLMIVIMTSFALPVASFLLLTQTYVFIWIFTGVLATISLAFTLKNPRRYTPTLAPIALMAGFKGFLRVIRESHAIRTATFFFLSAFAVGYHAIIVLDAVEGTLEYVVIGVVIIIGFPIIAIVIDNHGRKPLVYVMLISLGVISTFLDQPGFEATHFRYLKDGFLAFSVILLIILVVVFAGDLASAFSRGRITSVLLFCMILGAILGVMAGNYNNTWVADHGSPDPIFTTTMSNLTSMATFIAMFLFALTREQLQPGTTTWRDHLIRLHVIMNNGLSLVFKEFKKRSNPEENGSLEDLESGGITGLQQMLQEISSSRQRIRVLDHGDVYLIFHYGAFTTAVLFVEKNLIIYREMLANFHLQFEYINKDVVKENYINQEELRHVPWLIDNYFT
ncbi:MAG: hypothetical protein GYA24_00560 [Candidatus Lokiarchaeota archaeon]|nr:hypothetical protein [Candidatus Lokiarchaeota archaeon]